MKFATVVARYAHLFPDEGVSLRPIQEFLAAHRYGPLTSGKNEFGHITASALVVDVASRRILMYHHEQWKFTLQPGGHFEQEDESPIAAATRKLRVETAYTDAAMRYLPYDYDALVPLDIDTHPIPGDDKSGARHVHHDLRYVLVSLLPSDRPPDKGYFWYPWEDLQRTRTHARLLGKLVRFLGLESCRKRFYVSLVNHFKIEKTVDALAVSHLLPDASEFLEALSVRTNLLGIVPKPRSLNPAIRAKLEQSGVPVHALSRDEIVRKIPDLLGGSQRSVLLDIGGWFVPALDQLRSRGSILGIVEDTRNGQDKYEKYLAASADGLPFPVVSVAESALKANEDFLVGRSVVFSADAILRECGLLLEYLECSVVGFGKIGRSIAHHLGLRGVKVNVVETNPLRLLEAHRSQHAIRDRNWVNGHADVLFCATGRRGTDIVDFRGLKSGAFVFSVTSSDDEFDLGLVGEEFTSKEVTRYVTRFESERNHFYLINGGNAVNFLHEAVLGEFIQLVRGGMLVAMHNLATDRAMPAAAVPGLPSHGSVPMLRELDESDQNTIAKLWLEAVFLGMDLRS